MVFWHAPSQRWVMVLYVGYPESNPGNHHTAQIFNSTNLKDWTYQSRIDGFFDCPVLFELPRDGNAADTRWIIHCADMKHKVGRFDGKTFTPETELLDAHRGKTGESAYAPQIFRNMPDGRTVQIAWLYNQQPGARQQMTFPSELSLVTTPGGLRLLWQPVREIESLYGHRWAFPILPRTAGENRMARVRGRHFDIQADIQIGDGQDVEFNLRGISLVVHAQARQLTVHGYVLPLALNDGRLYLRLLLDETSLEIFADKGLVYLPLTISPSSDNDDVTISTRASGANAVSLDIAEIKSSWR